jgi:hypothetical protein
MKSTEVLDIFISGGFDCLDRYLLKKLQKFNSCEQNLQTGGSCFRRRGSDPHQQNSCWFLCRLHHLDIGKKLKKIRNYNYQETTKLTASKNFPENSCWSLCRQHLLRIGKNVKKIRKYNYQKTTKTHCV